MICRLCRVNLTQMRTSARIFWEHFGGFRDENALDIMSRLSRQAQLAASYPDIVPAWWDFLDFFHAGIAELCLKTSSIGSCPSVQLVAPVDNFSSWLLGLWLSGVEVYSRDRIQLWWHWCCGCEVRAQNARFGSEHWCELIMKILRVCPGAMARFWGKP